MKSSLRSRVWLAVAVNVLLLGALGWTVMAGPGLRVASAALIAAGVLSSLAFAAVLGRSITHPLHHLSSTAARIAEGHLDAKDAALPVVSGSELDGLAASLLLVRDRLGGMIGRIHTHVEQASATAAEVISAAGQMSEGISQQSAATEETSSAMEEIAAQIQGVSRNALDLASDSSTAAANGRTIGDAAAAVLKAARDLELGLDRSSQTVEQVAGTADSSAGNLAHVEEFARQINLEAEGGGQALDASIGTIRAVGDASLNASRAFEALGQRSRQITGIVETIAEIADQTNLLALNAAIEAARAGDSGRGFAVVADEVRKLAERSLAAAKEVAQLLGSIREETEHAVTLARHNAERTAEGARLVADAGGRMRKVMESVQRVSDLAARVGSAVASQSRHAGALRQEMTQLRDLAELLSQSADAQATSAAEVAQAAERISAKTRQVADATVQVRAGGEQVVKAIENISVVSRQNHDGVRKVTESMVILAERVDELKRAARMRREEE